MLMQRSLSTVAGWGVYFNSLVGPLASILRFYTQRMVHPDFWKDPVLVLVDPADFEIDLTADRPQGTGIDA